MRRLGMLLLVGALVGLAGCGDDVSWLVVVNNGAGGGIIVVGDGDPPDSTATSALGVTCP